MARLTDPSPSPPPRSPFLAPPPRPQLPPASPALQQRGWAALALAVLSLLAMTAISNIQRGVYVIAVALAVAIRRPRGVMAAAILSVIGTVLCSFVLAGFLVFWTQLHQYANCENAANTTATQTICQNNLNNSVTNEIRSLGGS
jgi:mannitol-specific phosphotransferase system IIBC component